jgi:hypothetical protein
MGGQAMGQRENQTPDRIGIQIFELTMDNPEDQDELNRQLQKPAEPNKNSVAMEEKSSQDPLRKRP